MGGELDFDNECLKKVIYDKRLKIEPDGRESEGYRAEATAGGADLTVVLWIDLSATGSGYWHCMCSVRRCILDFCMVPMVECGAL